MTGVFVAACLLTVFFRHEVTSGLMTAYRWLSDRDQIRRFVDAFGSGAPFVFMGVQVLQVILAPVPGEATGFIGGYLFGFLKGFVYSSLALSVGSWINFSIGRFLGKRFVRKWIPPVRLDRFNHLLKRQGILVIFVLFIFPGFPKDYLCLFLGITALPMKTFLLVASIGRMPGTLILSLQGEFLFNRNYAVFTIVFGITAVAVLLTIRYRETIYAWLERLNRKTNGNR